MHAVGRYRKAGLPLALDGRPATGDGRLQSGDRPRSWLRLAPEYLFLDVRPEFSADIGQEIEADLCRALSQIQFYRVNAVGIPLIREIGGAIGASQPPPGQCLAARICPGQDGTA